MILLNDTTVSVMRAAATCDRCHCQIPGYELPQTITLIEAKPDRNAFNRGKQYELSGSPTTAELKAQLAKEGWRFEPRPSSAGFEDSYCPACVKALKELVK